MIRNLPPELIAVVLLIVAGAVAAFVLWLEHDPAESRTPINEFFDFAEDFDDNPQLEIELARAADQAVIDREVRYTALELEGLCLVCGTFDCPNPQVRRY